MMLEMYRGSKGPEVSAWQLFLIGLELYKGAADGVFGPMTEKATKKFQKMRGLTTDGIVGNATYAVAMQHGFELVEPVASDNWMPSIPVGMSPPTNRVREEMFGSFRYQAAPTKKNPERVQVLGGWYAKNITMVEIPELVGVMGTGNRRRFAFNKKIANQVRGLFKAWHNAGLIHLVRNWSGSYCARFIRGSRHVLSNHAYGTAFDINYPWNRLGQPGARKGEVGSVRELVDLANASGFYWGGHYTRRKDPMHFEVAELV